MKKITVDLKSAAPAALLALDELKAYLLRIDPEVSFRFGLGGLSLEVSPSLFAERGIALADPDLDDAVCIEVSDGKGRIAGSNPRALLIAVYRFLRENGVRFLRPGADGEIVPRRDVFSLKADLLHAASYRHRGVCIEGSVSFEDVEETVKWLPKLGFNAYFIQFLTPFNFFQRYYGHEWFTAQQQPERLTKTIIEAHIANIAAAANQRGIVWHAVGHGWTCEPLGIPGLGWYRDDTQYPAGVTEKFALVNGKRELWGGVALNTSLCYSNPEVRALMTDAVAQYAAAHREIDVIHFWLADGSNNNCECEGCRQKLPSDFYVEMLNEIDRKLTERGLSTRVVFLVYVDLLWRPAVEKLTNPDRFILMFAPISRSYAQPLAAGIGRGETTPYIRNKLVFPKNAGDSVAYLKSWQEVAPTCDSFLFDYHFMWDYIKEPGGYHHARVLFEDMKHLDALGLNGTVSCQNQRVFFPTGLGMRCMADALWDKTLVFEDVCDQYYRDAFGDFHTDIAAYLCRLSETYPADAVRHDAPLDATAAPRFEAAAELCRAILPTLDGFIRTAEDPCIRRNLSVVRMHAVITERNCLLYLRYVTGAEEAAQQAAFDALHAAVCEYAEEMHAAFDPVLYLETVHSNTLGRKRREAPPLEN